MKLFKRKQQIEEQDNYEYWKDPRLGTDDDEGCYDYYACDKPDNNKRKCWSTHKCDDCGKEPRFKRYGEMWNVYWYCWDGWDGDSGFVCWKCLLKSKIRSIKRKFKDKIKQRKEYKEWIKMFKSKGIPITKELKEHTKKIVKKEW
jgi:hypothetical protein